MTLAEVIALINSDIVPNGNNEITANVLRPILIEMLQQPNDLIGELDELNTDENDTLVKAINSVNNALSDVDGLTILSGQGDPNQQSFPSLSIADLYSEIDGVGSPLALWIYDGTKFIRFSDKYLSYEIPQSLTPTEQQTARNNISALDVKMAELSNDLTASEKGIIQDKLGIEGTDLTGLLTNPTYDSDTHIFTMDVIGGAQFQIDFPIEALITNVDLDDDNNLVITFEDGSEVLVPLNTLLVGVVKTVNGKNPNSQGVVTINIDDIPNLQDELDNKADISDIPTDYLPLSGGTMTGDINWNGPGLGLRYSGSLRLRFSSQSTIIAGGDNGLEFRPTSYTNQSNVVTIDDVGQINTANHGNSSQWKQAYDAISTIPNPANDGLLTISTTEDLTGGGTFSADQATASNVDIGLSVETLSNIALGVTAHGWGNHALAGYLTSQNVMVYKPVNNTPYSSSDLITGTDFNELPKGNYTAILSSTGNTNVPENIGAIRGLIKFGADHSNLSNDIVIGTLGMAFRNSSTNLWRTVWTDTDFNPAQYVLQTSLNTQLANYVPINGSTTINGTKTFTEAPIVPNGTLNGHTVNLGQLNDKLGEKADIDGSNTTGGNWNIDDLSAAEVGVYSSVYPLDNAVVNIQPNDVLGTPSGLLMMKDGFPIVISENTNPDWDGYIYRAGIPKPGYPGNQQNGNYIIESKHRFRLHEITAPDSTSGNVGSLQINPLNGIEHNYFRVTISSVDSLDITIEEPYVDEITGFNIERNAIGQKCTVAVSGSLDLVKFNNVSGANFTSEWNKGVFEFYWTGTDWMFGGYSPIEP